MSVTAAVFGLSITANGLWSDDVLAHQQEQASQKAGEKEPERELTRAERRRVRLMKEYQTTGDVENCVPMRSLRQSHILDDQTIFFETIGKRGYINRLTTTCAGLLREERFAYSNSFGSLCRGQIITVLDNFGRSWGSCALGDFEEYEKAPKADPAE